ncbi:MAG TPA: glycosyltransferase family 39 protein [Polyangia bacterium]|nr:glycosyltransferase family 39 protein [Polyangia bacterium]
MSSAAVPSLGRRVARSALAAGALWYLGAYLAVALARLSYPYDLEWMEGGMLEHVARVLGGQTLYGPPSLEFTPYIYTPLYYLLAAPVAKLFGLRLLSLRVVSFAASLGVFALIAALVRGGTRSRLGVLVAVGLYAALFKRSGAFFDLARVDSLALLLTLLGTWLLLASERHDVAAGVVLAAAFFTKQSALLIGAPVVLARAWSLRGPRRLQSISAFGALVVGGSALLHLRTGGWSTYYLFTLPASHPRVSAAWLGFWRDDLLFAVPIALLAVVFVVGRTREKGGPPLVVLAAVLGALADAWSSRLHSGGYSNVLMPAYACLAWQTGTVLGWLDEPDAAVGPGVSRRRALAACAPWACLLQLALLWYPPWRQVPTSADRAAGDALVAKLAATPGPALVPFHPHLGRLAGKATYAQQMALSDVMRGGDRRAAGLLATDVRRRLAAREFDAVVVDEDWWPEELRAAYVRSGALFSGQPDVFWPRTGWPTRPRDSYAPRPVPLAP